MTPQQVIDHFDSQVAAAAALGTGQPTISNWVKRGTVPALQQLRLEALTGGALKADKKILSARRASRK